MSLGTPGEMARRLYPTRDAPGFDVADERRKIAADAIRARDETIRADVLAEADAIEGRSREWGLGSAVAAYAVGHALRAYAAKLGGAP